MTPRCGCCAHIWVNGMPRNRPARYRWVSAVSGNVVLLCVECCMWWRRNAAEDPDLAPSRITELHP